MAKQPGSIAVLGIGIMGAAVARNLRRKGFAVRAWNRTLQRAQALIADDIQVFAEPAEAVRGAQVIITLGKDGAAVLQAMQQARDGFEPGALWLQMATVGIEANDELQGFARDGGLVFYDAPVLGTRQPAEQGQLWYWARAPRLIGRRCSRCWRPSPSVCSGLPNSREPAAA